MIPDVVDDNSTAALLLIVLLGLLAAAILAIQYIVRKRDVLHGGFIESRDDRGRSG